MYSYDISTRRSQLGLAPLLLRLLRPLHHPPHIRRRVRQMVLQLLRPQLFSIITFLARDRPPQIVVPDAVRQTIPVRDDLAVAPPVDEGRAQLGSAQLPVVGA
jgi:hypothetical protein